MDAPQQQQLSSLCIDDGDGKRDWASLPLDLLKVCVASLKDDEAAKRAALASCKAFGRSVVQTMDAPGGLVLDVDRRAEFSPSVRIWRELWGEERPQQERDAGLALWSSTLGSPPGRCWRELLGAAERLAYVTMLVLQVCAAPGLLMGTSGARV